MNQTQEKTAMTVSLMPEAATSVAAWSAEQIALEMVGGRAAAGVTSVVWWAAVLRCGKQTENFRIFTFPAQSVSPNGDKWELISLEMWGMRRKQLLDAVAYPGILFGAGFNKFNWGQRERGSGGGSPLVRGSGGSCNLVQEISFHMPNFLNFWYFKTIYDDNQFICHCSCKTIANLGSFWIVLPFFRNILVCWRTKFCNF